MSKMSAVLVSVTVLAGSSMTALGDELPKSKQTKLGLYVTADEAAKMDEDRDVLFVDVRSRAEVAFLGLPTAVDVHMPYMVMPMMASFNTEKGTYDLELNPDFLPTFKAYAAENGVTPDTPIILMCRSGSRSARAADLLADIGYTQVYSLVAGFEGDKAKDGPAKGQRTINGWRNAGLQWSYKEKPDQVYPDDR